MEDSDMPTVFQIFASRIPRIDAGCMKRFSRDVLVAFVASLLVAAVFYILGL